MKKIISILVFMILLITNISAMGLIQDSKIEQINEIIINNVFNKSFISNLNIDPCISLDNGLGTADLPADCPYIAPNDKMIITNGLPLNTTIELDPILDDFINIIRIPGGPLGGEVLQFDATLNLDISGTGDLNGFNRNIFIPVFVEINNGPRNPGDIVQIFSSEIYRLSGSIFGDPDFCTFEIRIGANYGLPSPGEYVLTKLPIGYFNIDSFFDITYEIEFEGCPGSILEGMIGTTIDNIRIQQGVEVINNPPDTPSQLSGPSSGFVFDTLSYTSNATDPDGDNIKYGLDLNYDGFVESWTDYYPSGDIIIFNITFNSIGTYHLRLIAEDIYGIKSGWSTPKTVIISDVNTPPNKPDIPIGEINGKTGVSYSYYSSTTDPDGDLVWYKWDWGDGNLSEWIGPFSSGITITTSHIWDERGSYEIRIKAKDQLDESSWSDPLLISMPRVNNYNQIYKILILMLEKIPIIKTSFSNFYFSIISIFENNPPNKPIIPNGEINGKIGTQYMYSSSTIDPDGDDIFYLFDWDDGTNSSWLGPYISGDICNAFKIWSNRGSYSIIVKAKDEHGIESIWSEPLSIKISKPKLDIDNFRFIQLLIH
jgi:hypothetical protein